MVLIEGQLIIDDIPLVFTHVFTIKEGGPEGTIILNEIFWLNQIAIDG